MDLGLDLDLDMDMDIDIDIDIVLYRCYMFRHHLRHPQDSSTPTFKTYQDTIYYKINPYYITVFLQLM